VRREAPSINRAVLIMPVFAVGFPHWLIISRCVSIRTPDELD
jgi:hypothetical protein